jgi:hypothetical protein
MHGPAEYRSTWRGGEETRERVRDMSVPNTTSRPPVRRMFVHNPRSGMRLASLFVLAQFSAWLLFVAPFLLFFFWRLAVAAAHRSP